MLTRTLKLKEAVLEVLDELPEDRVSEVLDFAVFLKTHRPNQKPGVPLPTMPASRLAALAGTVTWGGDAITDAERLYEV